MEDLRNVESNIRNLAAHEIVSVTDETIKNLTGFYGRDIMSKIKELFGYTEISIRKEYWDSYDEMNRKILEQMSNDKIYKQNTKNVNISQKQCINY